MAIEAVLVIQDLAVVLLVALGMALLFHFLRQPLLIGYLLAGIVVGPFTPPFGFLTRPDELNLLAEIGIVFLLFAVGLQYPLTRLRAIGRPALIIALAESLATFGAGFFVGRAFGFTEFDSLFLGLALSVTSTVILSRVLEELRIVQDGTAGLVLAITVVEDVIVVSALGVLQSVAVAGSVSPVAVGAAVGLVALFVAAALVLGSRVVPRFIDWVASTRRSDLLLVALLGLAFGFSILSDVIGISVATGAFLAGVMVAESASQPVARDLMAPLKELFSAIFFVSMGALMNVGLWRAYFLPIVGLLVAAVAVKLGLTFAAARSQGLDRPRAIRAAFGLAGPGGEVSLTVVKGGADVGAIGPAVLPVVGAITLVTAVLSQTRVRFAWNRAWRREVPAQPEAASEVALDPPVPEGARGPD